MLLRVSCGLFLSRLLSSFPRDTYGTTRLIGQDTSVSTNRTVDNLLLKWIDTVLEVPGTVPQVLNTTAGTTSLADFAGEYLPSMVTSLNDTGSNYTFFAPTNEAVSAAMSTLDQATSDEKALTKAVQAHILPQSEFCFSFIDLLLRKLTSVRLTVQPLIRPTSLTA